MLQSLALELERSTVKEGVMFGGGVGVEDHGRRKEEFGWLGRMHKAL